MAVYEATSVEISVSTANIIGLVAATIYTIRHYHMVSGSYFKFDNNKRVISTCRGRSHSNRLMSKEAPMYENHCRGRYT